MFPSRRENRSPVRALAKPTAPGRGICSLLLGSLALFGACADPLWQAQIAALGPEQPGIATGPLHRTGQPCLTCHSPSGTATAFSVAGTVYRDPSAQVAGDGVEVVLIDAARRGYVAHSNCAGNFFVFPSEFQPQLPLWVSLRYTLPAGRVQVDMESPMHRDGDCGTCHQNPKGPRSAGPVFLSDDPARIPSLPNRRCGELRP